MSFNISQLKTDLSRRLAPASPNDSKDFLGAVEASARNLLSQIKPKELSRRVIIENALYDQVQKYNCPEDLDTNKIMQWYRLKGNKNTDRFYNWARQVSNRSFDSSMYSDYGGRGSATNLFTIEYESGEKFIKVASDHNNTGLTITNMNGLTDNGIWNALGNIVNLTEDNLTYVQGTGSLRFDINTSGTTGTLQNFAIESVNLKDYLNVGKVFTWLDLPNATQLQTVTLRLYSSLTDYYEVTVNSPHNTDAFQVGQNMLGFALNIDTMNTIGTPNPEDINGISFEFITNGTMLMKSVRIDNVVARKGQVYGIQYISNQMFNDAVTGLWKFRPTLDSDEIHVEYDTYSLLLDFATVELSRELLTDSQGRANMQIYQNDLMKNIQEYKKRHKEEFIDETQVLRNFGVPYGYYWSRGFNRGDEPQNRNS